MDNLLYNFIYSESEKTMRIHSDEHSPIRCKNGERLVAQVEGSEDAQHVIQLIEAIRPDLKVIEED